MIDGPSPLEIARSPAGWWTRSEEFYTAGEVLLKTRQQYWKKWNEKCVGREVTDEHKEVRRLINLETPIVFNLAFSIELLVKAILVQQNPQKWVPDSGNIKFGHKIHDLIKENIDIELSDLEEKIAKRIHEYVSYGKYPERSRPGDTIEKHEELFNYHPYICWSLPEFYEIISSLRDKLRILFLKIVGESKNQKSH